jgi:hypothetical protein
MLSLDDERWTSMKGGYRVPFDPRPGLRKLEAGRDVQAAWDALWQGLHHQGDVGEASYAAVPHLVRIHCQRGVADWNTYAMVATIELARGRGANPDVPAWLSQGYQEAIHRLAEAGLRELPRAEGQEAIRSILGMLAIWKGARSYGRVLSSFTEDELLELEEQASGPTEHETG